MFISPSSGVWRGVGAERLPCFKYYNVVHYQKIKIDFHILSNPFKSFLRQVDFRPIIWLGKFNVKAP